MTSIFLSLLQSDLLLFRLAESERGKKERKKEMSVLMSASFVAQERYEDRVRLK